MLEFLVILAVFVLGVIVGRPATARGRARYPRVPTVGPSGLAPRPPSRPSPPREATLVHPVPPTERSVGPVAPPPSSPTPPPDPFKTELPPPNEPSRGY